MALITAVSGAYTGSYTPSAGGSGGAVAGACGILSDDGFELGMTIHQERINRTDQYGQTTLETIYLGMDARLRYLCREYSAAAVNQALPFGKATGNLAPILGVIGRRGSDVEGSMVLTATTGTPSATNPATLTAAHAVASEQNNFMIRFTSRLREVPVELTLFPYVASTNTVWFTVT